MTILLLNNASLPTFPKILLIGRWKMAGNVSVVPCELRQYVHVGSGAVLLTHERPWQFVVVILRSTRCIKFSAQCSKRHDFALDLILKLVFTFLKQSNGASQTPRPVPLCRKDSSSLSSPGARLRLGQDTTSITQQRQQHATIGPIMGKHDVIHETGST